MNKKDIKKVVLVHPSESTPNAGIVAQAAFHPQKNHIPAHQNHVPARIRTM